MTSTHKPTNPPQCPTCEYNLTGLTEQRCPECGEPFDWDDVLSRAADPVTIAFERSQGIGRLRGFAVTWATVLFAPWVFARQICQHVSMNAGIAFGAACCIPIIVRAAMDFDFPSFGAWLATIWLHILAQAIMLAAFDPNSLREGWRAIRFWIAVGGYTTAVVVTECYEGPPFLGLNSLYEIFRAPFEGRSPSLSDRLEFAGAWWIGWITLLLWLIPVVCCYAIRLKKRGVRMLLRFLVTLLVTGALLVLYSYTSGRLAPWLWGAFGGSIG